MTSAGESKAAAAEPEEAPAWWTSAVVYQIYPRSFADSDGDGLGDLGGILGKLDYLEDLGVDVVWLSPIYRSPQDDNGYDISDYEHVDPMFGSDEQLDAIIAGLHDRGIRLVMDLVVNHTSDEHPWFVESRSSRDNPKRDWYWWRDQPTDWISFFSGSAWEYDLATEQYYLHLFSRKQPDLNWENPEVRQAVFSMMRRWLDRGVDGFRMDVINLISKVTPLQDAHDDLVAQTFNGPRIHEFLQEMHRAVFAGREAALITVGETPGVTIEEAQLYTDPARAEVDMVFQFEHVDLDSGPGGKWDVIPLELPLLKANLAAWQEGLADVGWNSLYWDNHDQPRAVSRFGDDDPVWRGRSAKTLATVLHLHRGTPYVYQGEELGMTNAPFAGIDDVADIESINHYREAIDAGADPQEVLRGIRAKGRDNARTPVQWDAGPHAGFTTGEPWIAANPNHTEINAAAQITDPDSVRAHYQRLIALRHNNPTVALGHFEMLLDDHPTVWAFTRTLDDDQLLVLANLSREPADLADFGRAGAIDEWVGAVVLSSTDTTDGMPDPSPSATPGHLPPWSAVVLRRP
ncbi:MAG: alpha-glucosidase [Dermatophilaceae bacterium]